MTQLAVTPRSSQTPRVEVKESGIHGMGLFACEPIKNDTYIGRYEGPSVSDDGPHVLWVIRDDDVEYGIDGQNAMRFVNHSTKPNASFYEDELFATRDIEAGEEITHHYGDDWEDV
jgi:SET domain-containing protein